MDVPASESSGSAPPRMRACEACRESKVRCRASQQPGICQRCFDSRKECIPRSGHQGRRGRKTRTEGGFDSLAVPAARSTEMPSSTFTINFALTAQPEVADTFDDLRSMHERHIEAVMPPADGELPNSERFASTPGWMASPSLTPASSTKEYPITELDGKPQFSVSSAESLLEHFISMSPNLPCIKLTSDMNVQRLAATKPFLLLAILTSASAAKNIHGHNLYDAEFRKVLGLKFVSAGERSLELFQGLLVYCAWYPFHLRPQYRQMIQYLRMGGDLVNDLGLDDDCPDNEMLQGTDEALEKLRAFLGYTYLESGATASWGPPSRSSTRNPDWILKCCEALEQRAEGFGDWTVAALARGGLIFSQAADAIYSRGQQTDEQRRLLLLGLSSRSVELQQRMPLELSAASTIKILTLFLDIYINSAGLIHRKARRRSSSKDETLTPDLGRLIHAVASMRELLRHLCSVDEKSFLAMTTMDWSRIIIAIIFAIKLSLPIDNLPDFDSSWARSEIQLADFLKHLCPDDDAFPTSPLTKLDALSATRIILKIVKKRFEERVQMIERREAEAMQDIAHIGCPFLDGSVSQYLSQSMPDATAPMLTPHTTTPAFDESVGARAGGGNLESIPIFHDIWATMTTGWARQDY